jgi:Uma2 family endonuclease
VTEAVPSVAQYVIASQSKARIEVFTRQENDGGWLLRTYGPGDRVMLSSVGCAIELDRVYTDVLEAEQPEG